MCPTPCGRRVWFGVRPLALGSIDECPMGWFVVVWRSPDRLVLMWCWVPIELVGIGFLSWCVYLMRFILHVCRVWLLCRFGVMCVFSLVGGCVGVVVVLVWWLVCCWVDWVQSVVSIVSWSCCVPWSRGKCVFFFHFECLECFNSRVECWNDCFFLWGWVRDNILSVWECRFFRSIVLFCHFFSSIGVCGVFKP